VVLPHGQKVIEEAAYQPLIKPATPRLLNLNEGLAALHCI